VVPTKLPFSKKSTLFTDPLTTASILILAGEKKVELFIGSTIVIVENLMGQKLNLLLV